MSIKFMTSSSIDFPNSNIKYKMNLSLISFRIEKSKNYSPKYSIYEVSPSITP